MDPQRLGDVLSRLSGGERVWFWACAHASASSPLALASFGELGAATRLIRQAEDQRLPFDAVELVGMGSVRETGGLQLAAPGVEIELLERIAAWVHRHVGAHPELARLRDLALLRTSARGVVLEHLENPLLWEGLPQLVVLETRAAAGEVFEHASHGESLWFWATESGPGGAAMITAVPVGSELEGQAFAASVARLRRRCVAPDPCVHGVARRLSTGRWVLAPGSRAPMLRRVIASVSESIPALSSAVVLSAPTAAARDLKRESELLADFDGETPLHFAFDGEVLTLDTTPEALQTRAGEALGTTGRVLRRSGGGLVFVARSPHPGFVAELAALVASAEEKHPGLQPLRGARFLQLGKDGQPLDRQGANSPQTREVRHEH